MKLVTSRSRRRAVLAVLAAVTLTASAARAADTITVTSLLGDGYALVSSWMSPIGPALFLQKGDSLYLCFVEEKPDTPTLKTLYCKPVE